MLAFDSMGHEVLFFNPYPIATNPKSGFVSIKQSINLPEKIRSRKILALGNQMFTPVFFNTFLKKQAQKIKREIQAQNVELIYANWGANMIPLVHALQSMNLRVPILYNFLSFPQNVYRTKVYLENVYCKRAIKKLDVRIYANSHMYNYFKNKFNLQNGQDEIIAPFFCKKYFYKKQLPSLSDKDREPHVIFIGPSTLPWDNINKQIEEITKAKIHFHTVKPFHPIKENNYLHYFDYHPLEKLTDGSLATFMTQFDACLTTFNFSVCTCMDRFITSYPSRFLFALNAGVPVVLPKDCLLACEDFVNAYGNGFSYKDFNDLKNKLKDNKLISVCRQNSIKNLNNFGYENNFSRVDKILRNAKCR
jgi:hypothetical protein